MGFVEDCEESPTHQRLGRATCEILVVSTSMWSTLYAKWKFGSSRLETFKHFGKWQM